MVVSTPSTDAADAITNQWVALAAGQRTYDSHVLAAENRSVVRESVVRRIVADELRVAREGGELAGFVMFTTESGQYDQNVTRGIVQNLYVVPDYRNRGLGTELLTTAENALAERGVDVVALEVMAANDDARRFYRRHGYDPHRVELEKSVESDTL